MAKYGNGITIRRQCMYEVAELRDRLGKYSIPNEEVDEICHMLVEPYFQWKESADASCVFEEFVYEAAPRKKLREFYSMRSENGFLARLSKYKEGNADDQFDGGEYKATELAE